jgi:hypothetical protein
MTIVEITFTFRATDAGPGAGIFKMTRRFSIPIDSGNARRDAVSDYIRREWDPGEFTFRILQSSVDELATWLLGRSCINISCVEMTAGVPKKSLHHFLQNRRDLTDKNRKLIIDVLKRYGYAHN